MLTLLDDGFEITAEPGRGRARLQSAERLWNDDIVDFRCAVDDDGVRAATSVRTHAGDGLTAWAAELAESYGGWPGLRTWRSLEQDLRIDASHDRRGHVTLRFTVRGPRGFADDAWEASVQVGFDAGEDMRRFAVEVAALSQPSEI
ncbi:MAG TPA: DUF6228 family protein [Actinoplanes sp.]|nr:DUF6228 family protein [Actinoplanes sp.]